MRPLRGWKKINVWPIKGPLLVLAGILGFLSGVRNWQSGWFLAGVAIVIPIIGFRDYWLEVKFWITIAVLGAAQIPLVVAVSPMIERWKFPLLLAFGVSDALLMVRAVSGVCSSEIEEKDGL